MSGLEFGPRKDRAPGCEFCGLPEARATAIFRHLYGFDQVLDIPHFPKNFFVMQNIVPLGVRGGHVMLLPKLIKGRNHPISLATIHDQQELSAATYSLSRALQRAYPEKPIFTFEHGPGVIQEKHIDCGGCHVDHAHGHMVLLPAGWSLDSLKIKTDELLKESGWKNLESRTHYSDIIFSGVGDISGINPYLQIGMIEPDGRQQAITYIQSSRDESVQSELERRVLAEVVYPGRKRRFYHWRDVAEGYVDPKTVTKIGKTLQTFRSKFESIV